MPARAGWPRRSRSSRPCAPRGRGGSRGRPESGTRSRTGAQCRADPRQPRAKNARSFLDEGVLGLVHGRSARSGTRPKCTRRARPTRTSRHANTSQMSGLRKFGQKLSHHRWDTGRANDAASQGRPVWRNREHRRAGDREGVMASADRLDRSFAPVLLEEEEDG